MVNLSFNWLPKLFVEYSDTRLQLRVVHIMVGTRSLVLVKYVSKCKRKDFGKVQQNNET